jgi:hypothetical protein
MERETREQRERAARVKGHRRLRQNRAPNHRPPRGAVRQSR